MVKTGGGGGGGLTPFGQYAMKGRMILERFGAEKIKSANVKQLFESWFSGVFVSILKSILNLLQTALSDQSQCVHINVQTIYIILLKRLRLRALCYFVE